MKNHECLKPARSNSFGEGVNLKSIEIAKLHLVDRGYEEKTTVLRLFKTRHCEGVRKHDCGNPEKNPTAFPLVAYNDRQGKSRIYADRSYSRNCNYSGIGYYINTEYVEPYA